MTNEDLKQIGELIDEKFNENFDKKFNENFDKKFDEKFEEKIEHRLVKIEGDIVELKQDFAVVKQDIENLAINTQNGFEEVRKELKDDISNLRKESKNDIFNLKIYLENKIDDSAGQIKEQIGVMISMLEKNAEESQSAKIYQILNIATHDKIKDKHNKLKSKVKKHDIRIETLEVAKVQGTN